MKYSDDKANYKEPIGVVTGESVKGDADSVSMPKITPTGNVEASEQGSNESEKPSFTGELISIAVKTVAVALSLIVMIVPIIAIGLPLVSMRIFNDLGMSARAIDFGERYISRELDDYGADRTDEVGKYAILFNTPELTNDDFVEALYVLTNLSKKLMDERYASGDTAEGKYYAERLEKYTRMYQSLNNVSLVNLRTDEKNMYSVSKFIRPLVYKYEHEIVVLNYRARSYLGKTDSMLVDPTYNPNVVVDVGSQSRSFSGIINEMTELTPQLLDQFVDFADMLGEYIDVELLCAGIPNDMYREVLVDGINYPIWSEGYLSRRGRGLLSGTEFSMFITRQNGLSSLFNQFLSCFNAYAQWAVSYVPSSGADREADMVRQLYWVQNLTSTWHRFVYMARLMYYSKEYFGSASEAIDGAYEACKALGNVKYEIPGLSPSNDLEGAYNDLMKKYISYQPA